MTTNPRRPWMGDIGEPRREITVEPFPEQAPIETPAPAPAEPVKEPEPVTAP